MKHRLTSLFILAASIFLLAGCAAHDTFSYQRSSEDKNQQPFKNTSAERTTQNPPLPPGY